MKFKTILTGALVGLLLIAPLAGILYLGEQLFDGPFVPFDAFNWFARVLPGPVITFGIDMMIDTLLFLDIDVAATAKTAERMMALGMFASLGVVGGAVFYAVAELRGMKTDRFSGVLTGIIFAAPMMAISLGIGRSDLPPLIQLLWLLVIFLAWGVGLNWTYQKLNATPTVPLHSADTRTIKQISRKQFLIYFGGTAAAITVAGTGLGRLLEAGDQGELLTEHKTDSDTGLPLSFPNSNNPVTPVPGTRPEYTPLKDHYQVFLNLAPEEVDASTWTLPITGMVETPLMLSLKDLRNNYPVRHQFVTLRCISGRISTSLISTTLWSGASLKAILADAGVQSEARYLILTSADGFHETIDLNLVNADERIMLTYDWDGNPLPNDHGFPLRVWIPDLYGMKQPKWITAIEVTDEYQEGYWVERGWSEKAQVKTTSVIDTVAVNAATIREDQQYIPIGGIAYSGARGISKVEIKVNDGPWQEAQLRSPLSDTTWVLWRFEWPYEPGEHHWTVRCAEADGTPQIEEEADPRPDGVTGLHMLEGDF